MGAERAAGIDLAEYLVGRGAGLPTDEFLQLARPMASRVAELHSSGWVHGEIGPQSFVLSSAVPRGQGAGFSSDRVTLVGSTRATSVSAPPRAAKEVEGLLHYVAPERTGRVQIPFDHRADVYSLGATFYEMLTGAPPFASGEPASVLHGHVAIVPPSPRDMIASIPAALSELVMRLLEKMPEHRYQTASAIVNDLEEVHNRLRASGEVGDFELGRTDPGRKLGTPRTLYGREPEERALRAALQRCTGGGRELVLLAGPSGIGKSSLARHVLFRHPWVGSSKFDALATSRPYATIADAVLSLLGRLIAAPVELRARITTRARSALAGHGRAVLTLLPNIELLTGTLLPLFSIDPTEGDPRTRLALRSLIQALAAADLPIVLLLDDLHWADSTTLDLIGSLLRGWDISHLLIVGTFRPDAVSEAHPLSRLLRELDGAGTQRLDLAPLEPSALTALCADLLHTDEPTVAPLAAVAASKATGNPLFVERFLHQLQREGSIRVDVIRRTCTYSLARIDAAQISDDVLELMRRSFDVLPAPIQNALAVAACFREAFVADDLSRLLHEPREDVEAYLLTARAEGILVSAAPDEGSEVRFYRFVHDRIKQTAYGWLDDESRTGTHLALGFQMLDAIVDPSTDDRLFEAVDHLNRGGKLLREPAARMRLVELHRIAAQRARASSGFAAAYHYFRNAIAFLPKDAHQSQPAVFVELLHGAIVCGFLAGEVHAADRMARAACRLLDDPLDKGETLRLRILGLSAADRLQDAIACVKEAALILGCPLPADDDAGRVRAELLELGGRLSRLLPDALASAPPLKDARLVLALRVLSAANAATWLSGETVTFAALQTRIVTITLEQGLAPEAGGALVRFGAMYAHALGDPGPAYEISVQGLGLALDSEDLRTRARARFGMAFHIGHFRLPLRSCVEEFKSIVDLGTECGEFSYAGYASHRGIEAALTMGLELPAVLRELDHASGLAHRYELQSILTDLSMLQGVVYCLQGRLETHELLGPTAGDLLRTRAELFARVNVWMLEAAYLFRRKEAAARCARAAEPLLRTMPSTLPVTAYAFYDALCRAATIEQSRAGEHVHELRIIEGHAARLEVWARSCPDNFAHKAMLVRAELERVQGRTDEALRGYAAAAAAAGAQGSLVDEATAHELAARLHWANGRTTLARAAVQEAMRLFARWGSLGKVDALAAEFLELSEKPSSFQPEAPERGSITAAYVDLLSVMRMVESVSSKLLPELLFERLVTLGLEITSAQSAALVLREGADYELRARGAASERVTLLRASLDEATDIPRSLVRAVLDQAAAVIVNDAQNDSVYGGDGYVRAANVQSAMAIPIRRNGEILGALYLESRLVPGAFARGRVRLLELLSTQMSIALENSTLFERLQTEVHQRRRAEDRVRFLAEASMVLADAIGLEVVYQKVVQVVVPFLADWATVDVTVGDGSLRRVASGHPEPQMQALLTEIAERYTPQLSSPVPAAVVLRTGQPVLIPEQTDSRIREMQSDARHGELIRRLGSRSVLAVPLVARGRTVGALTLHAGGLRPRFGPADVALAQELARRAAISIDNARLHLELLQSQKLEAIGRLSGGIAHDFNNFLAIVLAHAEELSGDRTLGADAAESVAGILTAARGAADVTRQLLAVGRKQVLRPQIVAVNEFLRSSSDILRALAGDAVEVRFELGPEVGEIEVDRSQLSQVVTNLVTNARDAMPNGGTISIRTQEVEADSPQGVPKEVGSDCQVYISVSDTGGGMDAQTRAHLFEPFYTTKPEGKGTGIGLATVKGIVDQSGGKVWVESRLGAGSRFTVCFPKRLPTIAAGPPRGEGQ